MRQLDLPSTVTRAGAADKHCKSERERYARAMIIMAAPGTRRVEMKASASDMPALSAYVHTQMGVVIDARNIPMPAQDTRLSALDGAKARQGRAEISMGLYMPDAMATCLTVVGASAERGRDGCAGGHRRAERRQPAAYIESRCGWGRAYRTIRAQRV